MRDTQVLRQRTFIRVLSVKVYYIKINQPYSVDLLMDYIKGFAIAN
jgi:hypothetical protein